MVTLHKVLSSVRKWTIPTHLLCPTAGGQMWREPRWIVFMPPRRYLSRSTSCAQPGTAPACLGENLKLLFHITGYQSYLQVASSSYVCRPNIRLGCNNAKSRIIHSYKKCQRLNRNSNCTARFLLPVSGEAGHWQCDERSSLMRLWTPKVATST